MCTPRWLREYSVKPSLTSVPKAVVADGIIGFLTEHEAFLARGTCRLFSIAYFDQAYQNPSTLRVFAMLRDGHKYRRLKSLCLNQRYYNKRPNLLSLTSLSKLVLRGISNLTFDKLPISLLRRLVIYNCSFRDLSFISEMHALEIVYLSYAHMMHRCLKKTFARNLNHTKLKWFRLYRCNVEDLFDLSYLPAVDVLELIDFQVTLHENSYLQDSLDTFMFLRELHLSSCGVTNVSGLRHLPNLEVLFLNCNSNLELDTLPNNLIKLGELHMRMCCLDDLSALSGCASLGILDIGFNEEVRITSLPDELFQLKRLSLDHCGVRDLSTLARFTSLREVNLESDTVDRKTIPKNVKILFELI